MMATDGRMSWAHAAGSSASVGATSVRKGSSTAHGTGVRSTSTMLSKKLT